MVYKVTPKVLITKGLTAAPMLPYTGGEISVGSKEMG